MRYPISRRVDTASGFSMLEVLIAGTILLFIALGLIPLFARAIRDNETGSDYTQATSGNKSRLEQSLQLPFQDSNLAVPVGLSVGQVVESYALGDGKKIGDANEGWWPGAPTDKGLVIWTRTTQVSQYGMSALDKQSKDYVLSSNERAPGGTEPGYVQLKEVEVVLESEKDSTVFGGRRRITFRVLKPF
jgi:hypothetical protein